MSFVVPGVRCAIEDCHGGSASNIGAWALRGVGDHSESLDMNKKLSINMDYDRHKCIVRLVGLVRSGGVVPLRAGRPGRARRECSRRP